MELTVRRQHGPPSQSEYTIVEVDAYNDINRYLAELCGTAIKTVENVVEYNRDNAGSEGGRSGVYPAFPTGQANTMNCGILTNRSNKRRISSQTRWRRKVKKMRRRTSEALAYTRKECREEGIDAALQRSGELPGEFSALLLCDSKSVGQQIAAQAVTVPSARSALGLTAAQVIRSSPFLLESIMKVSPYHSLCNTPRGERRTLSSGLAPLNKWYFLSLVGGLFPRS